jgi:hypothetical protein
MRNGLVLVCLAAILAPLSPVRAGDEETHPFEVEGMYVEGCTCKPPCACELTGLDMTCQGVGAFRFTGGKYNDVSLAGVSVAYAGEAGTWARLYVDAKDAKQKDAVTALAKAALKDFAPCEKVLDAKIEITGSDGKYTAKVSDGKENLFTLTTEPILGGDGKTPLVYSNIHDPIHPEVMQGKTIKCEYKDDKHAFKIEEGSNAYFQPKLKASGKL